MEDMDRIYTTTLSSKPLTHHRMKSLSGLAQSTEDHIARIGLGLSIRRARSIPTGPVPFSEHTEIGIEGNLGARRCSRTT